MSQLPLEFSHPTTDPERLFRPWEFSSSFFPITSAAILANIGQGYPMLQRDTENTVLGAVGKELVERGFFQRTHPNQLGCAGGGDRCREDGLLEHSNDISPRLTYRSDMQQSEDQSVDWDEPRAKVRRPSPDASFATLQVITHETSTNSQHMESPETSHSLCSPASNSEDAEEPLDLSGNSGQEEEISGGEVAKEELPPPPPLIPVENVEKMPSASATISQTPKREQFQLRSNHNEIKCDIDQNSSANGQISYNGSQQLSPSQIGSVFNQQYTPMTSSYLSPLLTVNPLSPLLAMNPTGGWGSNDSQVAAAASNALYLQSRLSAAVRDNLILQHQQQTTRAAQQHLAEYAAIHQQNQLRQQRLVLQQIQQEQQKQWQRQKQRTYEQQLMGFNTTQRPSQINPFPAKCSDKGQLSSQLSQLRMSGTSAATSHRILDQVTSVKKFVFPTLNEQIEAESPLPLKRHRLSSPPRFSSPGSFGVSSNSGAIESNRTGDNTGNSMGTPETETDQVGHNKSQTKTEALSDMDIHESDETKDFEECSQSSFEQIMASGSCSPNAGVEIDCIEDDATPQGFNNNSTKGNTNDYDIPKSGQKQSHHHQQSSPPQYQCTYCPKSFPREKTLQTHLRVHTRERPFSCNYPGCEKKFAQSGQLRTHHRLHSGEKPYRCPVEGCRQRFTHSNRRCMLHPNLVLVKDAIPLTYEQVVERNLVLTEQEKLWMHWYVHTYFSSNNNNNNNNSSQKQDINQNNNNTSDVTNGHLNDNKHIMINGNNINMKVAKQVQVSASVPQQSKLLSPPVLPAPFPRITASCPSFNREPKEFQGFVSSSSISSSASSSSIRHGLNPQLQQQQQQQKHQQLLQQTEAMISPVTEQQSLAVAIALMELSRHHTSTASASGSSPHHSPSTTQLSE